MTKQADGSPMYIAYRNKWRVIIKGTIFYFESYDEAFEKWSSNA